MIDKIAEIYAVDMGKVRVKLECFSFQSDVIVKLISFYRLNDVHSQGPTYTQGHPNGYKRQDTNFWLEEIHSYRGFDGAGPYLLDVINAAGDMLDICTH